MKNHKQESIQKLPTHSFVGDVDKKTNDVYTDLLDKNQGGGVSITSVIKDVRKVESLIKALSSWGQDLGYDLSLRLPAIKDFFIYKSIEEFKTLNSEVLPTENMLADFDPITRHINIISNTTILNDTLVRRISHELVHSCSSVVLNVNKLGNKHVFTPYTIGFWELRNGRFKYFNESLVELNASIVVNKIFQNNNTAYSYVGYVILLVGILLQSDVSLQELQKAMLLGDPTILTRLNFNNIADYFNSKEPDLSTESIENYAETFDLTELLSAIDLAKRGVKEFNFISEYIESIP